MTRPFTARNLLGATLLLTAAGGCHAREEAFYDEIFNCDVSARDSCGTTRTGARMTCFSASQLGGDDFCVPECDPAATPLESKTVCTAAGAQLLACQPDAARTDPSRGCPSGLQCYRTDLLRDEGLCMKMRVCTEDSDCTGDPTRRTCAATIVHGLYPSLAAVGNLQCLQPNCSSLGSSCQDGEVCLTDFLSRGADFPDICVPTCDAQLHCPPNFTCSVLPTPSGQAKICVPGLLGSRCASDQDCAIGGCLDTGAGFNECIMPSTCSSDSDCASLDGFLGTFVCAGGVPGQGPHCVAVTPFHGSDCLTSMDCGEGRACFFYGPYGNTTASGECRIPCAADLTCPPAGGVPHVCLAAGTGGCYPTDFALPCHKVGDCRSGLSCEAAALDPRSVITDPMICTAACSTDNDCASMPGIRGFGFCELGLCRVGGQQGAPCDRDAQCLRHLCSSGTCLN